jgi:hypothetical protein
MPLGRFARCMSVGFLLAVLAIGLLPFLAVYILTDASLFTDTDTSPILLFISKFIDGAK